MTGLGDLVKETLEKKGVLATIRAKLRKHVFDVVRAEEAPEVAITLCQKLTKSEIDTICLDLIRDFFSHHGLNYTLAMLTSEAGLQSLPPQANRGMISSRLRLGAMKPSEIRPLIAKLVEKNYTKDSFAPTNSLGGQSLNLKPSSAYVNDRLKNSSVPGKLAKNLRSSGKDDSFLESLSSRQSTTSNLTHQPQQEAGEASSYTPPLPKMSKPLPKENLRAEDDESQDPLSLLYNEDAWHKSSDDHTTDRSDVVNSKKEITSDNTECSDDEVDGDYLDKICDFVVAE